MLGFIVGLLGAGMLIYLIPGRAPPARLRPTSWPQVGDDQVTVNDVRTQLARIQTQGAIPPALQSLYAQQVLESARFREGTGARGAAPGHQVTDQERADRIRELIPTAFVGDTFVGHGPVRGAGPAARRT